MDKSSFGGRELYRICISSRETFFVSFEKFTNDNEPPAGLDRQKEIPRRKKERDQCCKQAHLLPSRRVISVTDDIDTRFLAFCEAALLITRSHSAVRLIRAHHIECCRLSLVLVIQRFLLRRRPVEGAVWIESAADVTRIRGGAL